MSRRLAVPLVAVVLLGLVAVPAGALPNELVAEDIELVGQNPLFNRGMNAALAVHEGFVYVGNRTDGQPHHPNPGVLVVDARDPAAPEVVGEIGPPHEGNVGETSRELRVWPQQDLLMVLNFGCSAALHACATGEFQGGNMRFYDIAGEKAADPEFVAEYEPSRVPHEFFLWVDPKRPDERALLFLSTPTSSTENPNLVVTDISAARDGEFEEVAEWVAEFEAAELPTGEEEDRRLHSLGVSNDGTRGYLAFLGAGFLVLDTSEVAAGSKDPTIELVTPPENRAHWSNPGAHSAVKVPGRDVALITDEVYGDALEALPGEWGCPWGWVRMINIDSEAQPELIGEYRAEENTQEYCDSSEGSDPTNTALSSYSAHNPTLTPDLAFVTWHSAGLEVFSITDPANPVRTAKFDPEPLDLVFTEDPVLTTGRDKTAVWSYPVIADGLIYLTDIRNGLYILRYTGEGADAIAEIGFLEGNSNLGDALRFEPVRGRSASAPKPEPRRAQAVPTLPATGGGAAVLALASLLLFAVVRRR